MKSCSMPYTIRQYRAEDEGEVVVLWNLCMPRDEIMLNTFRRQYGAIDHRFFHPAGDVGTLLST
jgi:hypothetical protein